jgi:hypothetical protein
MADIPPDFLKGQMHNQENAVNKIYCQDIPQNTTAGTCISRIERTITPIELAFTIQDPCGTTAIELAREVLKLISNQEDKTVCENMLADICKLNSIYNPHRR